MKKGSRLLFGGLMILLLAGLMAYLQIAFREQDAKTAVRLVEEAKAFGTPLRERLDSLIPVKVRLCETVALREMYGHMEVTCRDIRRPEQALKWRVNVTDGMVKPANDEAVRLGKGKDPWTRP